MTKNGKRFSAIDFKDRFPALDGVRAFAVTIVFLDHFGGGAHGGAILQLANRVRAYGWMGVDIFFVLSGFLITGILYDTRNDSQFFKRFFARRSLRIFPVFYLVVALLLALTPIFHYQWRAGHLLFLVYMGNFLANHDFTLYEVASLNHPAMRPFFGHFWSLCVEEQFYLLWPIAVWLVRDRVKLLWTATGISVLALGLRCLMCAMNTPELSETWIMRTLPFRMDSLLMGAILALVLRGPNAEQWQRMCRWIFLVSASVVVIVFGYIKTDTWVWILTIGLTFIALAAAGLIGMTLRAGSPCFKLFYRKPLCILGKYSYGFYVFHVLFGFAWVVFLESLTKATHSLALGGIIALTVWFVGTFTAAKLSYDLFEVKFLRWKKNFEYDSEVADHKHAFTTK